MSNMCPVCGYPGLDDPAYLATPKGGLGSLEICPSCGFQFGWTDDDQHITHEQWRTQWISRGMVWRMKEMGPPPNWNPRAQLLNVGVKI